MTCRELGADERVVCTHGAADSSYKDEAFPPWPIYATTPALQAANQRGSRIEGAQMDRDLGLPMDMNAAPKVPS